MEFVDGFVIPIPSKNIKAYTKLARAAAKVWLKHGALEYRECVGQDLDDNHIHVGFKKLARCKPGETVVFSWIVYKSRAHRDKVNKKVMNDPAILAMLETGKMPFDCKRMSYGGFTTLVKG